MNKKNKYLDGTLIVALSRSLQTIHRKSEMLFRQKGLTMAQFAVLEALLHKGDSSIKGLMEAVLSTSGNMTVVIRNLEKLGYVKRKNHPVDKRSYLITLTKSGKDLIEEVFKEHMELVSDAVSPMTNEEKETVIAILKKLA